MITIDEFIAEYGTMITLDKVKIFAGKIPATCADPDDGESLGESYFKDNPTLGTFEMVKMLIMVKMLTSRLAKPYKATYFRVYGTFGDKKDICHVQGTLDMFGTIEE